MQNIAQRFTGSSVRRSEDPRILTGNGHYIDDVRIPGMLHAAFGYFSLATGALLCALAHRLILRVWGLGRVAHA